MTELDVEFWENPKALEGLSLSQLLAWIFKKLGGEILRAVLEPTVQSHRDNIHMANPNLKLVSPRLENEIQTGAAGVRYFAARVASFQVADRDVGKPFRHFVRASIEKRSADKKTLTALGVTPG